MLLSLCLLSWEKSLFCFTFPGGCSKIANIQEMISLYVQKIEWQQLKTVKVNPDKKPLFYLLGALLKNCLYPGPPGNIPMLFPASPNSDTRVLYLSLIHISEPKRLG